MKRDGILPMNLKKNIVFFILELISGIGIGLLGASLTTPDKPKYDLNLSIVIFFLKFYVFAIIGIGIVGFFHTRLINGTYWTGLMNTILFATIGLLLGAFLSHITFDFLPYQISSSYIPILTPILLGVIGFHMGVKRGLK